MRFNLIGGYSVFNLGGKMSYLAGAPAFARLLVDAGRNGVLPPQSAIVSALPSISASHARYIVITAPLQPHRALVAMLSERVAGCEARQIADVELCVVPQLPV